MPFIIVRQDITKMQVDAIVNAANTELAMGSGVCGAIFKAAGIAAMQAACKKAAPIKTGGAAVTPGFKLPAKYVIHAAGPVYRPGKAGQNERLLRSAYRESLQLAHQYGCESIAFPLISSGIYGYPKKEALQVATAAIRDFLNDYDMTVYLAIFDPAVVSVSEELLRAVKRYLDAQYADTPPILCRQGLAAECFAPSEAMKNAAVAGAVSKGTAVRLDDLMDNLDEPFNTALLRLIDRKGKTDAEVYKRANIDRKLFSKIRTGKGYMPGKRTILALAVALELTLAETDDLLKRAGYALSHSRKFDVIVEFFIVSGKYDIFEINEVLYAYGQPLLGAG